MNRLLFLAFIFCAFVTDAQTLASQRLMSQSVYYRASAADTFRLADSARYVFNDSLRGSRFNYNDLQYTDISAYYKSPVADFINLEIPTNNIDSSEFLLVSFDTAYSYNAHNSTIGKETHAYLPDGSPSEVFYTYNPVVTRLVNSYNAGKLSRVYSIGLSNGVYDTTGLRYFFYDASGHMITDSTVSKLGINNYKPSSVRRYTYSTGAGYLTRVLAAFSVNANALIILNRTTAAYYPNGLLHTRYNETTPDDGLTYRPYTLDSFAYTTGVPGYTYLLEKTLDYDGSTIDSTETITDKITAGSKDSVSRHSYKKGIYQGGKSVRIFYDGGGFPIQRNDYNLDTNKMSTLLAYSRYYYNKSTGVGIPTSPRSTSTSLSPNPTTGPVTIHFGATPPQTPIHIRISSMSGQVVRSETFFPKGTTKEVLLGNEFMPGTYAILSTAPPIMSCTQALLLRNKPFRSRTSACCYRTL